MSDLFWLTGAQMARLQPFFPKKHGKPLERPERTVRGRMVERIRRLRAGVCRFAPSSHLTAWGHVTTPRQAKLRGSAPHPTRRP
jgi:hypothetical protein